MIIRQNTKCLSSSKIKGEKRGKGRKEPVAIFRLSLVRESLPSL